MNKLDDIYKYIPQYLSEDTQNKLLIDLSNFPDNILNRLYGFNGKEKDVLYQGDGVSELPIIKLPDTKIKSLPSIIISNTCDIDPANKRLFSASLQYAPILSLEKYTNALLANGIKEEKAMGHVEAIKLQKVTQIFYLPKGQGLNEDKIVFFDSMCSCTNNQVDRNKLSSNRLFSLSQYGHYLFLYKLSIHFLRLGEGVDRKYD